MEDVYYATVLVRRQLSEDLDVVDEKREKSDHDLEMALRSQLARELQTGWDEAGIAGEFQVTGIWIHP